MILFYFSVGMREKKKFKKKTMTALSTDHILLIIK